MALERHPEQHMVQLEDELTGQCHAERDRGAQCRGDASQAEFAVADVVAREQAQPGTEVQRTAGRMDVPRIEFFFLSDAQRAIPGPTFRAVPGTVNLPLDVENGGPRKRKAA